MNTKRLFALFDTQEGFSIPITGFLRPNSNKQPQEEETSAQKDYPLIPIRDLVIFPQMITTLFIGREASLQALEAALNENGHLVVSLQRDPDLLNPTLDDLSPIGTEVEIIRPLRLPDGTASVLVHGLRRVQIGDPTQTTPYIRVQIYPLAEPQTEERAEALMRAVLAMFGRYIRLNSAIPEETYLFAMNTEGPGDLADLIAGSLNFPPADQQRLLEITHPVERLQQLSVLLARELDILELEDRIQSRVQEEMERSQREHFLREQMRAIQQELGEGDIFTQEIEELQNRIEQSTMPEEIKARARRELDRLAMMPPMSPETSVIHTYLDWLLELPWTEATEDNLDIREAARILDESHYGLEKAKERILEHIAVRQLAGEKMKTPILCFVGPPGTGKTSLGQAIAKALGRRFVRVSLGGVRDEAEIRGHRRTYIGALPGRIIQTMRRAGTINPVFMLDEIDKLGLDYHGDPSAALLEALDPEQNHSFSDHYLEVPYDLSHVLFITTANTLASIPPALQDRLEVIEFPGYVEEEKLAIAQKFLIPRQLEANGLAPDQLTFTKSALQTIIREYTYEAGVRNLERAIATICRKVARQIAEGKRAPHRITARSLVRYLGPPQYDYGRANDRDEVGVATGIAWTETGGDLMFIEVTLSEGKGNLTLTGQLGEVMQESAQTAFTYVRAHAHELGYTGSEDPFEKLDVHIHVPEGEIPKEGPSAGITITVALASALTDRPVRHDIAMTGEITLRGRVLPVGGIREKVLAAYRAGLRTVILPERNRKDLVDLPPNVRKTMKFIFVSHIDTVFQHTLLPLLPKEKAGKKRKNSKED